MSEVKHTPGPWHQTRKHPRQISDTRGFKIAKCLTTTKGANFEMTPAEAEANARLIAAAPDMLEALEGFVEMYVDFAESGDAGFFDAEETPQVIKARAAIAKAKGEA